MKNKKTVNIIKVIGYFFVIIALCISGMLIFHSFYYELIYISGISMSPTLLGAENETSGALVDFGIIDTHEIALKNIKRFSIVSTYYPDEGDYDLSTNTLRDNAKKKIKRVIALPGETFKIEKSKLYILNDGVFENIPYTFAINPKVESAYTGKDMQPRTLGDNEYWVLGDNRENSRDSFSINKPVRYEDLYGVLVAIEGQGRLKVKQYICDSCKKTYKTPGNNGYCNECGNRLRVEFDVQNKQYHWPTFF